LLDHLSSDLSAQYGTGFCASNLERMRTFYRTLPKSSAPRTFFFEGEPESLMFAYVGVVVSSPMRVFAALFF
jgi:hypothetical protein